MLDINCTKNEMFEVVVVVAMQLITAVGKPIIIIGIQKNPITPKSDQTTVKEATK